MCIVVSTIASKIGPKPIQKPHPPIYLGGYSQNTFARIAKHANGWICTVRDSLSEVESNIDKIRHECYKINRDAKDIQILAIVYPNVIESYAEKEMTPGQQRHLFSGTIDQVGQDFQEVKKIGIDNVILNYNRSVIGDNTSKIIEVSKELSRFIKWVKMSGSEKDFPDWEAFSLDTMPWYNENFDSDLQRELDERKIINGSKKFLDLGTGPATQGLAKRGFRVTFFCGSH